VIPKQFISVELAIESYNTKRV